MQTAVIDKESLLKKLTAHRKNIRSFGVKQLSLFGSFVTGNVHQDSDIDLLVDFEIDKKTYDNFIELSFYLEELLGRRVELVTRQSLSKYIGPHILKQAEHVAI
jgi:predicted nucleotidyltransferase